MGDEPWPGKKQREWTEAEVALEIKTRLKESRMVWEPLDFSSIRKNLGGLSVEGILADIRDDAL